MSALQLLKSLRPAPSKEIQEDEDTELKTLLQDDYQLGSTKVLLSLDLNKLTRNELKAHLAARNLPTEGAKNDLIERLQASTAKDLEHEKSHLESINEEKRTMADLEERGSVYVVGNNTVGQLGVGDIEPRKVFTVIPELMGMGVCTLAVGLEMSFAVTEDHVVFVWGSMGVGPTGNSEKNPEDEVPDTRYMSPVKVDYLKGEDIATVSVGASHCAAVSSGGDCFVWGLGKYGRLGLGHERPVTIPTLLQGGIPKEAEVAGVACGQSHTVVFTRKGTCYAWGHVADGRLGVGTNKRLGIKEPENRYFPTPTLLSSIKTEVVTQVSCGPNNTLALTTKGVAWSWGSGEGGKLGHGDVRDRFSPTIIEAFQGSVVTQVACGYWHSACLVTVPPLTKGRMVYTWGSGYCGQLGQGTTVVSFKPDVVQNLLDIQVYAMYVTCGSHHMAMVDIDGELWTWGSNRYNCLGRTIDETHVEYTARPGHVGGFGAIVDRVGRGMPRAVACGKEYTLVATYPYQGPTEEVAEALMEERRLREEELAFQREQEANLAKKLAQQAQTLTNMVKQVDHATAKRLCMRCKECPGFQYHAIKQNLCRECGHSTVHHKVMNDRNNDDYGDTVATNTTTAITAVTNTTGSSSSRPSSTSLVVT